MEILIAENPGYHVRVPGIDITLDRKARKAMVWINQITNRHPNGVTRDLTGLAMFRYEDERWMMVHLETPIGMTGSPGFNRLSGGINNECLLIILIHYRSLVEGLGLNRSMPISC